MNPLSLFYQIYEKILWRQIKQGPTPHHIGLILDGNRRFARFRKLASNEGHNAGSANVESFLDWCRDLNVKIVTLYGFSVENYNRSDDEVDYLMNLILQKLKDYQTDPVIMEQRVKVKVLGRLEDLSEEMNQEIAKIEALTRDHENFQLNIAISYGGRAEIVDAVKKVALEVRDGSLDVNTLDEQVFSKYLYTAGIPDPDFIIRTSGEERLSGFLSWQSAYSELYFTEVFWPAFRKIDFWRAIRVYQQRERRFGK
jgi:undecaprenyl diphosphate synthase